MPAARFELRAELGRGGMGVVYRAYDRDRAQEVACKTLRRADAAMLYRFKHEFRALADLVHPNLVTLYELHREGASWFFTMELVEGCSLLEYVRPHGHLLGQRSAVDLPELSMARLSSVGSEAATLTAGKLGALMLDMSSGDGGTQPTLVAEPLHRQSDAGTARRVRRQAIAAALLDAGRLRAALVQLVEAVAALHRAGLLHRDLKPSNVLVDGSGRVAVCDFGLIASVVPGDGGRSEAVGTPAYMAPEQARGRPPSEASDWYSVGAMLYEALTGRLPFDGAPAEILRRKQSATPVSPVRLSPDVDRDLAALAMRLLAPDPAARPGLEAIRAQLSTDRRSAVLVGAPSTAFVGRRAQLDELHAAFAAARRGAPVAALVRGPSGMGKSTTVRQFLDEIGADPRVVILRGRCYQRETVPYKALDALVDELSSHLMTLELAHLEALLPDGVEALVRLFPVLDRVAPLAAAAQGVPAPRDPQALRSRAFAALRQLLAGLARDRLLVLHVDDLQWGDIDSAPLFAELLHHPEAPRLLLVASYRIEEEARSAFLRYLLAPGRMAGRAELRCIDIDGLSVDESRALVDALLPADQQIEESAIAEIVREAGGSPLFVAELVRRASSSSGALPGGASLDQVLASRIAMLPDDARAVLTAAAVAGRPIEVALVTRAARVADPAHALATLTAARMLRTAEVGGLTCVETYHDRIRETAVAQLPARELRLVHRHLARALERSGRDVDILALVEHWQGAGDRAAAGRYALRAAELAEQAAAFDRAAHHYALVLQLCELAPEDRARVAERLASALFDAGRLSDAAASYLEGAALSADRLHAVELERRALECLLCSGQLDEGLALADRVLRAVGLRMPRSPLRAIARVIAYRAWSRLRGGVRADARPADEIDPEELLRVDVAYSVSVGLAFLNPLLAISLQTRQVAWAMRIGEPYRVTLGRCVDIGFRSTAGGKAAREVERIVQATLATAERETSPPYVGAAHAAGGLASFMVGDFERGHERSARGVELMSSNPGRLRWYLDMAHTYRLSSLLYLGRLAELTTSVASLLREAQERGNTYLANAVRSWRSNVAWLILDRPDEARAQLEAVTADRPPSRSFHIHNYFELASACQIDLYAGRADEAWARLEQGWRRMRRGFVLRVQSLRIEGHYLRARCALAAAARGDEHRRPLLTEVGRSIRKMRAENMAWADALAALVEASLGQVVGDPEAARRGFDEAGRLCEDSRMAAHATVARLRRAALDGPSGARQRQAALHALRAERVASPERFAALLAPVE